MIERPSERRARRRRLGAYANAVNDDAGIRRDNFDRFRTCWNRHFDADEIVLNGTVAHRVVFADIGVAFWNGDILSRSAPRIELAFGDFASLGLLRPLRGSFATLIRPT